MIRKVYMTHNFFYYHIENEELLSITGSHVDCKSDSTSETVQDRHVVTVYH